MLLPVGGDLLLRVTVSDYDALIVVADLAQQFISQVPQQGLRIEFALPVQSFVDPQRRTHPFRRLCQQGAEIPEQPAPQFQHPLMPLRSTVAVLEDRGYGLSPGGRPHFGSARQDQ